MILIGRGLDFRNDLESNWKHKLKNLGLQTPESKLCSCQGCASNPRAPEEEEKDDGRGQSFRERDEGITKVISQISSQFPVAMTKRFHLFPYRTQKLSSSVPMVLDW